MDIKNRQKGIGGSDVAPILGLSRFSTALQIWESKVNQIEEMQLKPDDPNTAMLYWGHALEKPIIDGYADITGYKIKYGKDIPQITHEKYSWLIANVDGFAYRENETLLLEAKFSQMFRDWGDPGTDKIPVEYICQIQHYLHVCDLQEAHVAAFTPPIRGVFSPASTLLKIYRINRSDKIIERMLPILDKFWNYHVSKKIPPEPQCLSDVKVVYSEDDGSEKMADLEVHQFIKEIKLINEKIKVLKQKKESRVTQVANFLKQSSRLLNQEGETIARFSTNKNGNRILRVI